MERPSKKELLSLSFLLFATNSTHLIFMVGSITGCPVGNSSKKFAAQFVIYSSSWKYLSHFCIVHSQIKISTHFRIKIYVHIFKWKYLHVFNLEYLHIFKYRKNETFWMLLGVNVCRVIQSSQSEDALSPDDIILGMNNSD